MHTFGFVIHPLSVRDVARKYTFTRHLPDTWVEAALNLMSPLFVSHVTGVRSPTGAEAPGVLVGCPLTPSQMTRYPVERCYQAILAAVELAAQNGDEIVGLGAHTAVVGDKGITIAERAEVPVTTGNSYTVYTAIEGALHAAQVMDIEPGAATATVLGATGSIGRVCALLLAPQVGRLVLCARDRNRLNALRDEVRDQHGTEPEVSTSVSESLREADLVVAVTSAIEAIVSPGDIKPGAVVCDVARPRAVSREVMDARDDVLVIEGGAVQVPGEPDFGFDFGFPPGLAYACMGETILLALEGRTEDYSLGPTLRLEQVQETGRWAAKHGFRLAKLRSFEQAVTDESIERIKARARAGTALPGG